MATKYLFSAFQFVVTIFSLGNLPDTLGSYEHEASLNIKRQECDFVLRYIPDFGVGVYSGRFWGPDEVIEQAIGIL